MDLVICESINSNSFHDALNPIWDKVFKSVPRKNCERQP